MIQFLGCAIFIRSVLFLLYLKNYCNYLKLLVMCLLLSHFSFVFLYLSKSCSIQYLHLSTRYSFKYLRWIESFSCKLRTHNLLLLSLFCLVYIEQNLKSKYPNLSIDCISYYNCSGIFQKYYLGLELQISPNFSNSMKQ